MLFEQITILDKTLTCRSGCYVGTRGDRIAYIGACPPAEDFGLRYNGSGKLLMTGLINSHSHGPMTLLRGYAENRTLYDWLNNKVFPFEAKLQEEDIYNGAMLAFAEMLRFGVVSSSEMYYMGKAMGQAVLDSGIRGNISLSVTCFDDSDLYDLPIYQETMALLPKLHNAGNGRLKLDLSIHGEYTSTPKVVQQMGKLSKETGLITQIHLSETKQEHTDCIARHGCTPTAYFAEQGVLDMPVVAAHCVHVTPEDRKLLAKHGVTAVSCPVSNLKLASGFCKVRSLLDSGVNVAVGTDGPASNNSLNLWSDLKLLSILSKAAEEDPTAISPKQSLEMATVNGAKGQGRPDCGVLRVGNKADLIVLNLDVPWMYPVHSMETNLVYSAQGSDVCLTMVDGVVLYRDGEYPTLDIEKIQANAAASTKAVLSRLEE
ncbi:MAG: amidohydrolase [Oscillospiraceae bacterium]|nr:amidohydrolase [Oscillospiraceae bacterium]